LITKSEPKNAKFSQSRGAIVLSLIALEKLNKFWPCEAKL